MSEVPGGLITYCSNIHPGEDWRETFSALRQHIPAIKAAVSPTRAFPIGLRLSRRAAGDLTEAENRVFTDWLTEQDCFVPTLNGFPYGNFHAGRVKEAVYLPDWRDPERGAYTRLLADLLAGWLPDGVIGSISTVPVGFKGVVEWDDLPRVKVQLVAVLEHLRRIREERGRTILLALEPEPGCLLETTEDVLRFFDGIDLPAETRGFLGLCYDCCHQAVEFEDPADSLGMLAGADIAIAKVQVSSALHLDMPVPELLAPFNEPRYLHQVVVRRRDGRLLRYNDLDLALSGHAAEAGDVWRCHFHVPIFSAGEGAYGTTRAFLEAILPGLPDDMLLEVETYTWDVLPPELRRLSVTDSIIREIQWLEARRHASHRRT